MDVEENSLTQDAPAAETPAADPSESPAEAGAAAPEPVVERPARDFRQERIDRLVKEREEERRAKEDLQRKLEAATALAAAVRAPDDPPAPTFTEADIERLAEQKLAQQSFARGTQRIADEGKKAFPDFQKAIDTISQNFGDRIPRDFYEAIIDLDNGHEVFREIALDPDLTDRILALSPTRRAVEIGKLATKPKGAPAQVSRAPAPISPIRGGAAGERSLYDEKVSTQEWMAKREAELAAKRGAR